jgi:membrane protease YdiL (CAAX protease family)
MKHALRTVLFSRHGELRSGWRLFLFLVMMSLFTMALAAPILMAGIKSQDLAGLAVVVAVMAASFVMTRFVNRKPFAAIGLWLGRRSVRDTAAGVGIGIMMMAGIFVVELLLGYAAPAWQGLAFDRAAPAFLRLALTFTLGAVLEELLFRGYAFQTLVQGITFGPATVLVSLLFALAHAQNPNVTVFALFNVALAGVWLSVAYFKTRGLWLPVGLHFGWNFAQTGIFGFPTSGAAFAGLRPIVTSQSGPEWVTGGAFGPEGGVLATLALIGGTWYLLKSPWCSTPPAVVTLESIEDILRPQAGDGEPG